MPASALARKAEAPNTTTGPAAPRQLEFWSEPRPTPRSGGWWTLNTKATAGSRLQQRAYRLDQLETVLRCVDRTKDNYISQAFFSAPNRRALNVLHLTHGYVDLDVYRIDALRGFDDRGIVYLIQEACQEAEIPLPTFIVASGRGYYAKWAWRHVLPKQAAGRMVAVHRALVTIFADLGADRAAVDVSRILRVVGTTNTKSGEVARIVWQNEVDGQPAAVDFDDFCERLLPYSLEDIREFRRAAKEKFRERGAQIALLRQERARRDAARRTGAVTFNRTDWCWKVVCDLEAVAQHRWGDAVPEGHRDTFLFLGAAHIAMTMNDHAHLWHEISAWARRLVPARYIDTEFKSACSSLFDRARRAAAGERVEWNGQQRSPLYQYSKDTVINLIGLTDDEMRGLGLHALISTDLKNERRRDKRREGGRVDRERTTGLDRDGYDTARRQAAEARGAEIDRLRQQGLTWEEVASTLDMTEDAARSVLKRWRKGGGHGGPYL